MLCLFDDVHHCSAGGLLVIIPIRIMPKKTMILVVQIRGVMMTPAPPPSLHQSTLFVRFYERGCFCCCCCERLFSSQMTQFGGGTTTRLGVFECGPAECACLIRDHVVVDDDDDRAGRALCPTREISTNENMSRNDDDDDDGTNGDRTLAYFLSLSCTLILSRQAQVGVYWIIRQLYTIFFTHINTRTRTV